MTENKQYREQLITKSLLGKTNNTEQKQLKDWLAESEENQKEYNAYTELWTKSKSLVLSNSIDTEASLAKTKNRIFGNKNKVRWISYLKQIAAVLIISVAISSLYNYFSSTSENGNIYQEISAAYGTKSSITMEDGTKIWLNSGSRLRYPTSFKNQKERRIELDGEAYFEVTKNTKKPFIVNTNELDVKVLGTSFNVCAYSDYHQVTVALKEGKVSLLRANSSSKKEILTLAPNQAAVLNKELKQLSLFEDIPVKKYMSWKDGMLIFQGDNLETVVQKLEKWYNVDIQILDEKLRRSRVTATFTDETLNQALYLLCISSGINYNIKPAKMKADGSYTKRKITLSI